MDVLKQFGQQFGSIIKESKERWQNIEKQSEAIKQALTRGEQVQNNELAGLLLLIVEQMRPLYTYEDQDIKVDDIIKKMLKKK